MLPQEFHDEARKLLCIWLHRLEEKDRKDGTQTKRRAATTSTPSFMEDGITNQSTLSDLPSREHTGAEAKRQR